jgi:hypothetical protein
MQIDGRKLSIQEKAFVRRISVQRVWDGERPSHVTASYGLNPKEYISLAQESQGRRHQQSCSQTETWEKTQINRKRRARSQTLDSW